MDRALAADGSVGNARRVVAARRFVDERGVLLVSSYLPELVGVSDRVAVMFRGRLQAARPVAELNESDLMVATMTGGAARA